MDKFSSALIKIMVVIAILGIFIYCVAMVQKKIDCETFAKFLYEEKHMKMIGCPL
jgi:hypothetical protein